MAEGRIPTAVDLLDPLISVQMARTFTVSLRTLDIIVLLVPSMLPKAPFIVPPMALLEALYIFHIVLIELQAPRMALLGALCISHTVLIELQAPRMALLGAQYISHTVLIESLAHRTPLREAPSLHQVTIIHLRITISRQAR